MLADAVIVAAGSSRRFGREDKLAAALCRRPVLAWSLAAFEAASGIGAVILVTAPERRDWAEALAREYAPPRFAAVVPGGARRRDSVEAGLRASRARHVAIHDGARPLVTPALIERVLAASVGRSGAIPAIPVTDTVKEVDDGLVTGHPERSRLWAAQTPQVVLRHAWLDAARAGDDDETDDAAMLARLGLEVAVAQGAHDNIKITRPADLALARVLLAERRQ